MKLFLVIIPSSASLTPDEMSVVDAGGPWPVRVYDEAPNLTPELKTVIDFLVDAWARQAR